MKTIDINAKEWFDKVNGNSYFAAKITLNYGTDYAVTIKLPFQYGYGNHYEYMAVKELEKQQLIANLIHYPNGGTESLQSYCERNGFILHSSKQENCKKSELKNI